MIRLDTSPVEAGGEVAGPHRSPSFPNEVAPAVAKTAEQVSTPPEPSPEQVRSAARQLEAFMQSMNRYLEFRVDQDSGRTVVTVKDGATGETIRQIPSEEIMRLAQNLGGTAHTGLLHETA